jgi:hypothetical protein
MKVLLCGKNVQTGLAFHAPVHHVEGAFSTAPNPLVW